MRGYGFLSVLAGIVLLVANIIGEVQGKYEYDQKIGSYWSLADKASTIKQKAEYMDKFVAALEGAGLAGEHDAVWLKTPDNSFDANLDAVKSLQRRLHEIEGMDVTSFQYQTAIQQITAQEQGEAKEMLHVFEGVWWKVHHSWLWKWKGALNWTINILGLLVIGGIVLFLSFDRY